MVNDVTEEPRFDRTPRLGVDGPLRVTRRAWLAGVGAVALVGCRDKQAEVAKMGQPAIDALLPLIERDAKQIRDGLPKGAALMAKHLDEEPSHNPEQVRRAIEKARAGTDELARAKGTFFIFVGPDGMVLRGESEPDLAAGSSLTEAVPSAKALLKEGAGLQETWGYMKGLRGVNKGDDIQWIVGHPVEVKGKYVGSFVTGFSLRAYVKVLELALQSHLLEQMEDKTKAPPLAYPYLVKGPKAYGGLVTPDENMEAIAGLDLPSKGGPYDADIEIDGRPFHVSSKPAPSLGDDVALALTLSAV